MADQRVRSTRNVSDADVLATLPPGWDRRECYLCSRPLSPKAVGLYTPSGGGHRLFACLCKWCVERIAAAVEREKPDTRCPRCLDSGFAVAPDSPTYDEGCPDCARGRDVAAVRALVAAVEIVDEIDHDRDPAPPVHDRVPNCLVCGTAAPAVGWPPHHGECVVLRVRRQFGIAGPLRNDYPMRPKMSALRAREILYEYPDADLSAFDVDGDVEAMAREEGSKAIAKALARAAEPSTDRCPECRAEEGAHKMDCGRGPRRYTGPAKGTKCPECNGERTVFSIDASSYDDRECSRCRGTGKV